jgi:hypothetical protein
MRIIKSSFYAIAILVLCVVSAASDSRPTPTKIMVLDTSCFQLVPQVSNMGGQTGVYVGQFAWTKTLEGGQEKWTCAPGGVGLPPQVRRESVWTADDSDKQFVYFRSEVDNGIVAAVKDNIVTKDQVKQYIETTVKAQLEEAVAKEVKKQQEAKPQTSSANPSGATK